MHVKGAVSGADLKQAIEKRDGKRLADFYTDDAVITIIDRLNPPSRPRELAGRGQIAAYWEDICGRDMTHEVAVGPSDGERLALTEACAYPDGTRVFCASLMELAEGRIQRQTVVQAWDE